MGDIIITGASRGIGRALASSLAARSTRRGDRLLLVARDGARLVSLVDELRALGNVEAEAVPGNLASRRTASLLGEELVRRVGAREVTLIHNAGLWPARRELDADGLEAAFVVNCLGPLAMQRPLLDRSGVRRIMVVGAGLMMKGRFDPDRTPTGRDFSMLRTYASTKLAFAIAMREVAKAHPAIDVLVLHPGVVRTDLGARGGPLGWLVNLVKRRWESPEICGERLARIFEQERWSMAPGEAKWMVEEQSQPWPDIASDERMRRAVIAATTQLAPVG